MKPKSIKPLAVIVIASAFTTTLHALTGTWTGGALAPWDTTATNWSGVAGTPWDAGNGGSNLATFNTLGATPAVTGTVHTNGITFSNTATVSGGTINLAGTTAITTSADATIGSIIDGTLGLTKAGANKLTLTGPNIYTGATAVNTGNLTISGTGAITSAGNLTVTTPSTATYSSSATSSLSTITVGTGSSATATFSQSAGTINATAVNLATGQNGNGNYNLSGTGTLALTGALGIGTRSGVNWYGVFSLSAGTLTANSINVAPVAGGANSFGRLDISGGTATSTSNLNLTTGSPSDSTGRLAIASLRGGRLAVNGVNTGTFSGNAFSAAVLNFAGGTIVANAANSNFISGLTNPFIYGGTGANIDTNGNDITISKNLQGTSGSGVTGVTGLTGGTGYTASTSSLAVTFSAPDLSPGKAAQGYAMTNASGVVTNIIVTDPGTGYSAAPTITSIAGGGTGAGVSTINIGLPTNITTTGGGLGKKGLGKLTLSGTNTFIGPINVDNGTLSVSGNHSAATGGIILRGYGDTGTTYNTIASTADFETTSSVTVESTKTIQAGNTVAGGGFQLQTLNANGPLTNDGSLFVGRSGRVNVGGIWTQNGSATVATQGGGTAILTVASTGSFIHAAGGDFILRSSGSVNTTSDVVVDGGSFTTGTRIHNDTVPVTSGSSSGIVLKNAGTLKLSANIADLFTTDGATRRFVADTGGGVVDTNGFSTTLNVPVSGTGGLTKSGAGTLTLTETNTYSGDTTVSTGTLSLGQVNTSNESSTVSIASGAFLNLTFGGTDTVASLVLNGVPQAAGVYGSGNSGGRITGGGTITVAPQGYTSWANSNAPGQTVDQDHDNDGVDNGIEYFMGQSGSGFTAQPVPNSSGTVAWTMGAGYTGTYGTDYVIQTSTDLAVWTDVLVGGVTISPGVSVSFTITGPGKQFARLLVRPN